MVVNESVGVIARTLFLCDAYIGHGATALTQRSFQGVSERLVRHFVCEVAWNSQDRISR